MPPGLLIPAATVTDVSGPSIGVNVLPLSRKPWFFDPSPYTPTIRPVLSIPVAAVNVASGTSIGVKLCPSHRKPWSTFESTYTPTIPLLLIPYA